MAEIEPGQPVEPWAQAGATWVLTGFRLQPLAARVREVIDVGP